MKHQLLLIEDVDELGRSGDIVTVKPGYSRNFLIPKQKAVVADKRTLKLQQRLKEERAKKAVIDKKEAEELAARVEGMTLTCTVKVDPEGNMYGSVTALDILQLLEKEGIILERKNLQLPQPIRKLGLQDISLKLKESTPAKITLQVVAETTAVS